MTCRQCGTEIAEKALICFRCGTPTTDPQFKPAASSGRRSSRRSGIAVAIVLALLIVLLGLFLLLGRSGENRTAPNPGAIHDERRLDRLVMGLAENSV